MQFGGVFSLQQILDQLPGVAEPGGLNISQRQIVAVIVGRGIDLLGLFKKRGGFGNFASTDVGFTQVVVGIKAARFEFYRFPKLLCSEIQLSQAREICGEVGSGRR